MSGYLRRLIKVECDCGTMANYLNVKEDHGVVWFSTDENGEPGEENPLMNANDHEGDVNLMCFGKCKSESNKVFGEGAKRNFHIGSLMDALGSTLGFSEGYKCTPYCSRAWEETENNVWLDGAPAITADSYVTCYYGGTIRMQQISETESETENATNEGTSEGEES